MAKYLSYMRHISLPIIKPCIFIFKNFNVSVIKCFIFLKGLIKNFLFLTVTISSSTFNISHQAVNQRHRSIFSTHTPLKFSIPKFRFYHFSLIMALNYFLAHLLYSRFGSVFLISFDLECV